MWSLRTSDATIAPVITPTMTISETPTLMGKTSVQAVHEFAVSMHYLLAMQKVVASNPSAASPPW